jgi:DNA-binding NarL/FixJ family response regulator
MVLQKTRDPMKKRKSNLERLLSACFDSLSARESHILYLMTKGLSNAQIADRLFVSHNTVANHVKSILEKTRTSNRTSAAVYAARRLALRKSKTPQ